MIIKVSTSTRDLLEVVKDKKLLSTTYFLKIVQSEKRSLFMLCLSKFFQKLVKIHDIFPTDTSRKACYFSYV